MVSFEKEKNEEEEKEQQKDLSGFSPTSFNKN